MNIYDAIMSAADFIEAHPSRFNFSSCGIPRAHSCGSPGCALGWIGAMYGLADPREEFGGIALVAGHSNGPDHEWSNERSLLGIDQCDFYARMERFHSAWTKEAVACAYALRLYAEKYHGQEKPVAVPDWNAMAAKQTIPDGYLKSPEYVL